ncbi:MAG TPA: acyltransferase [Candidatus Eremiobacteraceae bacterium]|nr:acyltransferase [Candidatus Eremiobacteraceae bacterium]
MKTRIGYIDGLRAVAVLSVIVHHAAKYNQDLNAGPLQHTLYEGAHGVDLFFVISGFCLAYPTLVRLRNEGQALFDVARYFAHRLVRILPPYYLAIGFCWLLVQAMIHYRLVMPFGIVGPAISPLEIFKQMIFADARPQLLNGSFWSLAVEFRWYFLFPLLLALWVKSPRAFAFVGFACLIAAHLTRAAGLDIAILPAFMLGIVAADIEVQRLPIRRLAPLLFVLTLCLALVFEPNQPWEFFGQTQWGWQAAAFFFVIAAGCVPWLNRVLSVKPLVAIGLASYSMYLIHEPIIGMLERNTAWGAVAAAVIASACGIIFWALLERPFVETSLKRTLVDGIHPRLARGLQLAGIPRGVPLHWLHWRPRPVEPALDLHPEGPPLVAHAGPPAQPEAASLSASKKLEKFDAGT